MAPAKDEWIRRFIITETRRHKKGFTIYKVISMVFLKSSHEEISKVYVWKRYNDFKKLHSELGNLHRHLGIKEFFPTFPKSKYFGRFEADVLEERKKYALKFLEFVGQYSYLYSSDIFITFFETSHIDNYANDYVHSLSSDTYEDNCIVALNDSVLASNTVAQSAFQMPCLSKTSHSVLTNNYMNENEFGVSQRKDESHSTPDLQNGNIKRDKQNYKLTKLDVCDIFNKDCDAHIRNNKFNKNNITLSNMLKFDNLNNISNEFSSYNAAHSVHSIILHEEVNSSQVQLDSTQYLLIAAAHVSAAFKHESIAEYEEAFMQYKLGILCLINGVQFDTDGTRIPSIKDKISKYLARAEQLYNRHLHCNMSIINKPVSELQYYKVLKVMKSVMLVMDIRANCNRIIKTIEKSAHEDNISNYVLREQVPYMVHLYAYVETETTVFLILQYANCGKLWDIIKLHYKVSDSFHANVISNHIYTNKHINEELNKNGNIQKLNKRNIVTENKLERDHQYSIDVQSEIYMEIPTMQLLKKSQKLLQSVNATLKRSNSIVNRLNESKELRYSENIPSLKAKTVIQISHESDLALSDVYRNKFLNSNNIKINDIIIAENLPIKNFVENKDLNGANSMNSENSNVSKNICMSVLNGSCAIRNSLKNKKKDVLFYNSASNTVSMQNISTNNMVHFCKNYDTAKICDWANSSNINYSINETQYSHLCKENNIDEERKFWQIPEAIIRLWAAEIILALEALHQQGVLIVNFKPDNILLDDTGHIQLTYIVPQHNIRLSKLMHPYSSPESAIFSPTIFVTPATDIWSFGIVLYELLTGIKFAEKHPGLFHSHSTISIPSKLSESARSLLYGILKYHPNERLTIDEIKHHPFFAEIDWFNMINSQI